MSLTRLFKGHTTSVGNSPNFIQILRKNFPDGIEVPVVYIVTLWCMDKWQKFLVHWREGAVKRLDVLAHQSTLKSSEFLRPNYFTRHTGFRTIKATEHCFPNPNSLRISELCANSHRAFQNSDYAN